MATPNEAAELESMMGEHPVVEAPAARPRPKKPPRSVKSEQKQVAIKADTYEVAQRRRKVAAKNLRGLAPVEIAHELGLTEHMVRADLDHNRRHNAQVFSEFEQAQEVGNALARYDEIRNQAWEDMQSAVDEEGNIDHAARAKYLEIIRKVEGDKIKVMQESGLLSKEAERVEHKVAYELPWTPEMKRAATLAMLGSVLTPQLAAPEPEIIDVELVPDEAEVARILKPEAK